MCTSLSFKNKNGAFFGRNMDLSWNFGQSPLFIPRNFMYLDRCSGERKPMGKTVIGMGTLIDGHPSMAEAMNESGLACAGLNFAHYAHWEKCCAADKVNVTPYDFILWVLSGHDTVEDVRRDIEGIEIVDIPINDKTPCPTLHWMISDRQGQSIVVEKTAGGIKLFDNPVCCMTNDPCFDWHLTNLREYLRLIPAHPEKTAWNGLELKALGLGAGTLGMPGDFASVSRFVRTAFAAANMPELSDKDACISQCFHMLDYAAMVKGCVMTPGGGEDLTLYSSCMDMSEGIYYYKTYGNYRISAVDMNKEDAEGSSIKLFPYSDKADIKPIN